MKFRIAVIFATMLGLALPAWAQTPPPAKTDQNPPVTADKDVKKLEDKDAKKDKDDGKGKTHKKHKHKPTT